MQSRAASLPGAAAWQAALPPRSPGRQHSCCLQMLAAVAVAVAAAAAAAVPAAPLAPLPAAGVDWEQQRRLWEAGNDPAGLLQRQITDAISSRSSQLTVAAGRYLFDRTVTEEEKGGGRERFYMLTRPPPM